ncbi:MAG: glycosyltransferase [Gluconacetobacter diazotrophicus]|nr:glycosyltransferase [Gluconacetobacter diazotrophicus]
MNHFATLTKALRAPPTLTGFVDRLEQGDGFVVLAGWIATADRQPATLPVSVALGSVTVPITRFFHRDDLARKGIADGECSFVVLVQTDETHAELSPLTATAADGAVGRLQPGYQAHRPFAPRGSLSFETPNRLSGRLIDPAAWLGRREAVLSVAGEIDLILPLEPLDLRDEFEIADGFPGAVGSTVPAAFSVSVPELEERLRRAEHVSPVFPDRRLAPGEHPVSLNNGDGAILARDRIVVQRQGKGYIEAFRGSAMHGWAAGSDTAVPAEIDILWDDVRYVTVRATEQREDLIRKDIVSTGGGFRYLFRNAPGSAATGRVSAALSESGIRLGCNPDSTITLPPVPTADTGFAHVQADAKDRPVCVIIPIHNAAADLARCLASLAHRVTMPARLILVEDCSTDPAIEPILAAWEGRPNVLVIRNARNLGFSGSINAGIEAAGDADVVLLNSDTIVTTRWLEKLRQAAYSARNIATVTALSCNAGAFSVPEIGCNIYPDWMQPDSVNRMIQACSGVLYPEAPTGNGFCMYVRRDCLDAVGLFDAAAFPRGYGEENDFCMRAMRAGFRNIVDDRTFIHHKRSASFGNGDAKAALYENGRAIVSSRYPEYGRLTSVFSEDPAFLSVRWRVRKALADVKGTVELPRPRVLYVISTQSGGTPQTNRDLMGELGDRYETWLMRCDAHAIELSRFRNNETVSVETHPFRRPINMGTHRSDEYDAVVARILTAYAFELVHIRHIAWHSLSLPALCRDLRVPVVFSFHDFYAVCPTVKLLDENNKYCAGRCTATDGDCRAELWPANQIPPLKHRFIHQWQERMNEALEPCDAFVTTSPGAAALLRDILPTVAERGITVIPHGRSFDEMELIGHHPTGDEPLRILMPGNINPAKGSELCEAVLAEPGRRQIEFHVLGDAGPLAARPGLVLHGRYKREEFGRKARAIRPHVGAVLSIWPETYCHTLTEMWAAGLPVVAVDLGAVGERIRRHGGGWLLPPDAGPAELNALLRGIRRGDGEFERRRADVLRWQSGYGRHYTTRVMSDQYDLLYRRIVSDRRLLGTAPENTAVVAVISQFIPGQHAPASAHVRIGETTRNDADLPVLFRHYGSAAMLAEDTGRPPAAVLVQRDTLDPDDVDAFLDICRARNIRVLVDCDDDLLSVPDDKDAGGRYRDGRSAFRRLLRAADLVSVSTPALVSAFAPFSGNVRLVPNTLSARLWLPILPATPRARPDAVVALYMGTATHDADLLLLREPVERIRARFPNFELHVIGGQRHDEDWFRRIEVPADCRDYPRFVSWFRTACRQADFALAPLVDGEFNGCKSDLKFLDYAAAGLSGIFSDVPSYRSAVEHAETGLLTANDPDGWEAAIENMITGVARRHRMATRAGIAIRDRRMSIDPGSRLREAILAVLHPAAPAGAPAEAPADAPPEFPPGLPSGITVDAPPDRRAVPAGTLADAPEAELLPL